MWGGTAYGRHGAIFSEKVDSSRFREKLAKFGMLGRNNGEEEKNLQIKFLIQKPLPSLGTTSRTA
jgi:hypothetical protein